MREKLANLCHEQWSGWMQYLFSKCEKNIDGTVTMPQWAVERWVRQMLTPYADLSEAERDSDRTEADKFLGLCGTENDTLIDEVEQLRVQLAGCSCAALGTGETAAQGDYGWSPPYQDVLNLRDEVERLKEELRLSKMAEDMALAASEEMTKENKVLAEITAYLEPITKTPADCAPWGVDVARVVMGMLRRAVGE